MDFLHDVVELRRLTGVDFPDSDYSQLGILAAAIAYLRGRATGAE